MCRGHIYRASALTTKLYRENKQSAIGGYRHTIISDDGKRGRKQRLGEMSDEGKQGNKNVK
jgi:hypothetical protein